MTKRVRWGQVKFLHHHLWISKEIGTLMICGNSEASEPCKKVNLVKLTHEPCGNSKTNKTSEPCDRSKNCDSSDHGETVTVVVPGFFISIIMHIAHHHTHTLYL